MTVPGSFVVYVYEEYTCGLWSVVLTALRNGTLLSVIGSFMLCRYVRVLGSMSVSHIGTYQVDHTYVHHICP